VRVLIVSDIHANLDAIRGPAGFPAVSDQDIINHRDTEATEA
jgi:hypothetical protein